MEPKISIIIPLYNSTNTILRAIKSVREQKFKNFECIIVDDGSTDDGARKALKYFNDKDNRFRIITKKNGGVSSARNEGIKNAKGEWITFLDSDDSFEPNRLLLAFQAEQFKNDIIKIDIINKHNDGSGETVWSVPYGEYKIEDRKILSDEMHDNSACYTNIYKRSLIIDNDIWFPDCDFAEDLIFNSECYLASGKLFSIEIPLYNYFHDKEESLSKNISQERILKTINEFSKSLQRFEKYPKWNLFKDIYINNFVNRKSILKVLKNKIDYVVPYVNGNDEEWIEKFNKYSPKKKDLDVNGSIRFDGDDEMLKYHFRSLAENMPFINNVHFIVDDFSQVPKWLDTNKIHVVRHKDFIPNDLLPVFNSCAIEMFLQNIAGLSEKFIYSNDDVFYLFPLKSKFYFTSDDKLKIKLNEHIYDWPGEEIPLYKTIATNSWNVARYGTYKEYNNHHYPLPPHIEQPYRRSTIKRVFEENKELILKSISRFRDSKNLNQYLFLFDEYFNRNLILESHSYGVLNSSSSKQQIDDAFNGVRSICFNDTTENDDNKKYLLSLLRKKFPNKCKYEK